MSDGPADPIAETVPSDDAGGLAQDRFDYQVHLAAARCAWMLVGDEIVSAICEWHEDYVVQYRTAPSALVSVKHFWKGTDRRPRCGHRDGTADGPVHRSRDDGG